MNCVACKEPMVVLEVSQVEIDHCLACGGIWLDAGELESLLDDPQEAKRFLEQHAASQEKSKGDRKCPICHKRMLTIAIGEGGKIEIDHCPDNHGLWFDRGELQEVVQYFDKDKNSQIVQFLQEMFRI